MGRVENQGVPRSLGSWIRYYRLRQRQLHTGSPWAQEDLAVAIASDKSHVNRIECDRSIPTLRTLGRMCDALALSWPERSQLLTLAGYLSEPPEATELEIELVVRAAEPILLASAYPLCLLDRDYRVWSLNDLHAHAWLGFPDRETAMAHVRGFRTIDKMLDPRIFEWWQLVMVDFDVFIRRQLTRLMRVYEARPANTRDEAVIQRIQDHPVYGPIWREVRSVVADPPGLPFLDHQSVTIEHPELGRYTTWIWHSSLAIDERFFISHHIPADANSQALLEHLAIRLSKRRLDPLRADNLERAGSAEAPARHS